MQDNPGAAESGPRLGIELQGQATPLLINNTVNKTPEGLQGDTKSLDSDNIQSDTPGEEIDQATGKRSIIRWKPEEEQKLVEILNALRDTETRKSGITPSLNHKPFFEHAATTMRDYFSTPRTSKGCFSHWARNRDQDAEVYSFTPKASRKPLGTASHSKQRPSIAGLSDNEVDDDNVEEEEDRTPGKRKKTPSKSKAKVNQIIFGHSGILT